MDRTLHSLQQALCSSTHLEKSMYACLQAIPKSIACDGIFFNYYRSDIHCIQFLALATHKTARPKWDVIPIPENIARQFNYTDNFSTQIIDNLSQCPLTEYVVNTCFRNIKSLILMRMNLDNLRLGAFGVFSYHANVFTHRHMQLFEAVRGELSLLAFIALSRHNILQHNDLPLTPRLPAIEEHENFVVSPSHINLYHLYGSLNKLANSESPIILIGEEGVGKKTFANALQQKRLNDSDCYGIIDSMGRQLIIMQKERCIRCTPLDYNQAPSIIPFLPLHQGSLLIQQFKTLPERWQTFLFGLTSTYREYCQMQVIAIQTEPYLLPISEMPTNSAQYIRSQRYANVFCQVITLPPLRYRHDDIPLLLTHYLGRLAKQHQQYTLPAIGEDSLRLLWEHSWPGNISEFIAVLENAYFRGTHQELAILLADEVKPDTVAPLDEAIRQHIQRALHQTRGKISGTGGAAELLGINSNTLYSKMKKLGIVVKI
ncbi:hypothetical protein OM304_11585 [Escherichia albertii]|nr:hypothetical protein [Escherichia albertii]MCZ9214238.1 hypothetical protein [Escherichia albertii]MCZ9222866.1 hypothetical protein [Escherichia albertii]